ncbi:hypothetical protein ACFELO_02150 [Oceanicaulis sp. LC35]|uniref:hypothetical protein n=1 Tax=Oceanicaulis sp. LC35 TaxID=3349635 RepID=UPI003F839E39
MKTLIALAAVSFITTGAMATDAPSLDGERYSVELPNYGPCFVTFASHSQGETSGMISMACGEQESADPGQWDDQDSGDFSIYVPEVFPQRLWTSDCESWPSIEVGETVSDPCWMTSTTGEPIQVTRER